MDPMQQLIAGNVVAGAAGALVQQTLSAGGGWIKDRYAHHRKAALQQATTNAVEFVNELGERVQRLAESNEALQEQITTAMEHPDFALLMERAYLSASQTDSHAKHVLLAQLISERLRVDEDTTAARASHRACLAIADLTNAQLKMLGFLYTLGHMPMPPLSDTTTPELLRVLELEWVHLTLKPYADMTCTDLDRMNLQAVGCLSGLTGFLAGMLSADLNRATSTDFAYTDFISTELGARIKEVYDRGLFAGMILTSVGSLIGMFVADQLANRPTDLTTWAG